MQKLRRGHRFLYQLASDDFAQRRRFLARMKPFRGARAEGDDGAKCNKRKGAEDGAKAPPFARS